MSHGSDGSAVTGPLDAALAARVAEVMQALATPSRVRILSRLKDSPCSVGEIALTVGMEQSAVSHQLRILRHLGLVVGTRHGRQVVYALHDPHVGTLLEQATFHVEHRRLAADTLVEAAS